jgi:hypothetical protein
MIKTNFCLLMGDGVKNNEVYLFYDGNKSKDL